MPSWTGRNGSDSAPDLKDNSLQQQQAQQQRPVQQQLQHQRQTPNALALNPSIVKILYKRTLKQLASLPLAIGELFVLAGLSAIGTVIEQNKPVQFYLDSYPDGAHKVLGFLTYRWIFALQFDHIYTAPYFLGLMALLGASLAACTSTRQLPMVKLARRCTFNRRCELCSVMIIAASASAAVRQLYFAQPWQDCPVMSIPDHCNLACMVSLET